MTNENQENQKRIVRKELNLDFGNFFYPNTKRRIFDVRYFYGSQDSSETNKEIRATLFPNPKLGILTTFDERVFYILSELWEEQGKQDKTYFSIREIARRLKLEWGTNTKTSIKHSLIRLRTAYIEWIESFYNKEEDEYISIENHFMILNTLEITSNKSKGIGSQMGVFSFDEKTVKNLELKYSRPVNLDVILSFDSSLSQSLYTHLDRKLYGTREYSRTTEGLLIEDLGLIGNSYKLKHIRLQKLKNAQKELIGKELAFGEIIENIQLDTRKRGDSVVKVTRSSSSQLKSYKVELPKTNAIKEQPQPQESYEIRQVLEYFDKAFCIVSIKSPKVISKTEELLRIHGIEKLKFLINFSKTEAIKTKYQPNSFNGINKYFQKGLKQFETNQKFLKNQPKVEEEKKAKLLASKNDDYKAKYQKYYYEYVLKKLELISLENPIEYNRFIEFQEQEKLKLEDKYKNKKIETKLKFLEIEIKHFNKNSVRAERAIKYFQKSTEIKIKDFWEWDKLKKVNLIAV